ncbi:MAG TPA: PAS domain-containing protein [Pirellulales bacterium]
MSALVAVVAHADDRTRARLALWLTACGCSVREAVTAAAAIEECNRLPRANLGIIAWDIPGGALEVCRRVRQTDSSDEVFLIVSTPPRPRPELLTAIDAGADDCLVEPASPARLAQCIADARKTMPPAAAAMERNKALQDLDLRMEAWLEHLLGQRQAVVFCAALDGRIVLWNSPAEEAYPALAMTTVEPTLADVFPPDVEPQIRATLARMSQGLSCVETAASACRKGDDVAPVRLTMAPVKRGDGAAGAVVFHLQSARAARLETKRVSEDETIRDR